MNGDATVSATRFTELSDMVCSFNPVQFSALQRAMGTREVTVHTPGYTARPTGWSQGLKLGCLAPEPTRLMRKRKDDELEMPCTR